MVVADLVVLVSCKQDILLKSGRLRHIKLSNFKRQRGCSSLCTDVPPPSFFFLREGGSLYTGYAALTVNNFSKLSNFILQNPERCARQYQTSVMARY